MRLFLLLVISLWFSSVLAQEKTDSVWNFYDFKVNSNQYELDFQKKINRDSLVYSVLDSLKNGGFYTLTLDSIQNRNVYMNKGKMYQKIWVKSDSVFVKKEDWFAIQNLDSLIQSANQYFAKKGFPFVEITIQDLGYRENELQIGLNYRLLEKRTIDGVQVQGYEKLSKGFIKHGLGLKKGMIYNESELLKLSERMNYNSMIEEIRPAQTLFNTDSTTIYLYVNKVKSNIFDGILGFGNDLDGKFQLNGSVLIELNNNFNSMERIRLNWRSTPDKTTSLDLNVRIPYLFSSPLGSQTQLNLFKQDSTYVNTKLEERLFYQITMNSNLGVNFSFEDSNFVLNEQPGLASLYDDFTKTGIGMSYEYILLSSNRLFEGKSKIYLSGKALTRKKQETDTQTLEIFDKKSKQYEVGGEWFHLFRLHPQHYIKTDVEAYALLGDDEFSLNELYRIGGFGSIRGFNEESLVASAYGIISLEYRFLPNENFYISVFGDYAYLENKPAKIQENLGGTGAGFSFLTQLGVFNLSYAVGRQSKTGFDFKSSKIHFGIVARF